MKIILATDGSEFSDAAVEKCCQIIADPENTKVLVISVHPEIVPIDNFVESREYAQQMERKEHEQAEVFAERAASRIRECFAEDSITVTTRVSIDSPVRGLIEAAKEWDADLIVVGSHGRGFWGRVMVGSVTDSVVHHAPCSVLVVRKK